jgi:hypothetical protein
VNYALKLSEMFKKTAIVDLDIVNPFFRTADAGKALEERGIKVLVPQYANTNVDVPSLPTEINMLFEDTGYHIVLDVGGDDLGARVLSRYYNNITADDSEMYFVINTRRPMTVNDRGIEEMIGEIQESSRLKVDWLVNNTNLLGETTPEVISEGGAIIDEVSLKLGIPVGFMSGMEPVLRRLDSWPGVERLYMKKHILLPWDKTF